MPKQTMQRKESFSADDFFDNGYDGEVGRPVQPYTDGSLAVEVAIPDEIPESPAPIRKKKKKPVQKSKWRIRKAEDMARIKSKFNFFMCAGLVLAGCLSVVLMYVQVFSQKTRIGELQDELVAAQEANAIAEETVVDQMTMADLYSYATGTLGMVEADGTTTIRVKVTNQSYTTSSLPVEDASESKVSFHWFGR